MNATTKARSYEIRRQIADALGKPQHADFTCEADDIDCILNHPQSGDCDQIQAQLLSTTNAGFNGIDGHFRTADGRTFTRSLGCVAETLIRGTAR